MGDMRIAITSDLYYPMTNGVAVFAHNLAKGLAERGHDVLVICPSFSGRRQKVKKGRITTIYVRSVRFPFYPDQINEVPSGKEILGLPLPRLAYRHGLWVAVEPYHEVKKALDRFRPDVIHNQTAEMVAIAGQRYAKKNNVPMVSTGHAYPDNITSQLRLLKPLKKPLDAFLRVYMASFLKHSEYATMPTEMAIEDLVPKRRKKFQVPVEALSNGVDLSKFHPGKATNRAYRKFHLPKDRPIIMYVGRVDPEKSISNVVLAFAGLLESVPEAMLAIVGDGTDRRHLQDLVKSLGIEQSVRFVGRVSLAEATQLYKMATIFATASETETQGIVLIEAAATGLPLVAVDAGAVKELCQHKQNGLLVERGDIDAMTDAFVRILRDEELRKKFSAKSIEIAQKHDLNRTLMRFEEIYREAIKLKEETVNREN